ncbi:sigma factor-like helix-turn-helix DNA-binding protein [Actinoplanes sp. NEAU-A12]|uniref:Sigma factor-like helix-turn-helix DNA-binding protein n=1 Tax=Actinoplanes sandaracinus TaxID=3045177 RepID=A0ABT6WMI5_9ACTN|nr:sigma factor-like helix-turn-helix DNA-binding protein [Actinoplanes sandaracinus]MDI6100950.1 sigma factor-like helix-turn-helix DNA-binding protein [Actinoplanes sandaracinus]
MEFAIFYESARDDCLRTVTAVVGHRERAEDLVAEAFARAWASWPSVARHPAPRAWVVRTALNAHVSWWRRWRREIPASDWVPHDRAGPPGNGDGLPDTRLMAALRALPERQRQVVALRIFLDLDSETTARTLGIAAGTVTAHLARATRTLRDHLEAADETEALR